MDSRDGRYGCTCPGCLMDSVRTVQDLPTIHELQSENKRLENALQSALNDSARFLFDNERLREALEKIQKELGVPQPDYPAPISNAYNISKEALRGGE